MDLNVDNYSINEVKDIFNFSDKNINISNAQKALIEKIDTIKKVSVEELPESKEILIEFYTKAMFKLLSMPIDNNVKIDSSIFKNFERNDANVYDIDDKQSKEFISARDKLIPPLENTPAVQTNNNFVTRHIDFQPVNTFSNPLKAGDVNPLTRNTLKKILNINTKFRNNYTITDSTNFNIELPSTVRKVVSMKLVDAQFPEMVYTISDKLGSNSFIIDTESSGGPYTIDISNGSYNSETIVDTINKGLAAIPLDVELSFNQINGLMTFIEKNGHNISLNFNYVEGSCPQLPSNIYKDQLTLGWLLGFRGNYIKPINSAPVSCKNLVNEQRKILNYYQGSSMFTEGNYIKSIKSAQVPCGNLVKDQQNILNSYYGSSSYTGESLFDPHGSRYFLISINDFQNNHNSNFISPFQYQTVSDNNIIAKLSTVCCNGSHVEQPTRIYFGPTDITKLEIKIYDEFGRIIDINNADYSFTLELDLIYDL